MADSLTSVRIPIHIVGKRIRPLVAPNFAPFVLLLPSCPLPVIDSKQSLRFILVNLYIQLHIQLIVIAVAALICCEPSSFRGAHKQAHTRVNDGGYEYTDQN
jgi:hypothetical protein